MYQGKGFWRQNWVLRCHFLEHEAPYHIWMGTLNPPTTWNAAYVGRPGKCQGFIARLHGGNIPVFVIIYTLGGWCFYAFSYIKEVAWSVSNRALIQFREARAIIFQLQTASMVTSNAAYLLNEISATLLLFCMLHCVHSSCHMVLLEIQRTHNHCSISNKPTQAIIWRHSDPLLATRAPFQKSNCPETLDCVGDHFLHCLHVSQVQSHDRPVKILVSDHKKAAHHLEGDTSRKAPPSQNQC